MTYQGRALAPLSTLLAFGTLVAGGCGDADDPAPVCGDGVREGIEVCDPGNPFHAEGCDDECRPRAGWACEAGGCDPVCGDGQVVGDEACDGDYCELDCSATDGACGDGQLQLRWGEECDDGNDRVEDGCDVCTPALGYACDAVTGECTASGIAPDRQFFELDDDERLLFCAYIERLLAPRPRCNGIEWYYAGLAACLESIETYPQRCTVASLEAWIARQGVDVSPNQGLCRVLTERFECEPVCDVSPCDPFVTECGCDDGVCTVNGSGGPVCAPRGEGLPRNALCSAIGDCRHGDVCVDVSVSGTVGQCLAPCREHDDCGPSPGPGDADCIRSRLSDAYGFCATGCDPFAYDAPECPRGTDCRFMADGDLDSWTGQCFERTRTTPVREGLSCTSDLDCETRLVCGRFVSGGFCAKACLDDGDCSFGQRCFAHGVPGVGFCAYEG